MVRYEERQKLLWLGVYCANKLRLNIRDHKDFCNLVVFQGINGNIS